MLVCALEKMGEKAYWIIELENRSVITYYFAEEKVFRYDFGEKIPVA